MAFKVLILTRKREDLNWQDFVDAYEQHCDWMQQRISAGLLAPLVDYRRSYVLPEHRLQTPMVPPLDFDVMAEAWFIDEAGLDHNNSLATDEGFLAETIAELSQYLQVSTIRYIPVQEMQRNGKAVDFEGKTWSA